MNSSWHFEYILEYYPFEIHINAPSGLALISIDRKYFLLSIGHFETSLTLTIEWNEKNTRRWEHKYNTDGKTSKWWEGGGAGVEMKRINISRMKNWREREMKKNAKKLNFLPQFVSISDAIFSGFSISTPTGVICRTLAPMDFFFTSRMNICWIYKFKF